MYGPVRTVVWEGSAGDRRPYPDCAQDGRIEKDPDRRIQAALEQVFSKFRETRSIRQTLLWFVQENISFPRAEYEQGRGRWIGISRGMERL